MDTRARRRRSWGHGRPDDPRGRSPATALFWRLFAAQRAGVHRRGARCWRSRRATVSRAGAAHRGIGAAVGLALMLAANALLLRARLRAAGRADRRSWSGSTCCAPATPGRSRGNGDVAHLIRDVQRDARPAGDRAGHQQRARAGRPGGRAAAHRPGAARRDRPEPDRGAAGTQTGRSTGRPSELRDELQAAQEMTRDSLDEVRRSPAGCAPACWTTSGCSARCTRWPRTSPQASGVPVTTPARPDAARAEHATPNWCSTGSPRRA